VGPGYGPLGGAGTPSPSGSPHRAGRAPGFYYFIAIPLLVIGAFALVASVVISQGVSAWNRMCGMNPYCVMQSNPGGAVAMLGGVLLAFGIGLIVVGAVFGKR
jgi:hypothetical protein